MTTIPGGGNPSSPSFHDSGISAGTFRNYPQKYPKAQQRANEVVQKVFRLMQKGPKTLAATVVDTSYHLSQGYVLGQMESSVVRIYGVPYGSVVNQMRVLCHQIGASATNRAYVFDSYAPNISALKTSGSILVSQVYNGLTSATATSATMPSIASLASSTGYYWHCFFYLPQLPPGGTVTLLQMTGGTNKIFLEYLPTGLVQFRSQDNKGYVSQTTVAPHSWHWIMLQPGLTGNEMLIDGVVNYSGLPAGSVPTFSGGGQSYSGTLFSNSDGTQVCPLGSWISKLGYGTNYAGGAVQAFSTSVPSDDTQIPNLSIGTGRTTANLYLCTDTPGSATLANAATGGGSTMALTAPYSLLVATGPYS